MPEKENPDSQESEVSSLVDAVKEQTLEITIRKDTNEIILRDPAENKIFRLKPVSESPPEYAEEDQQDEDGILTPEEFEDGVSRIYKLGLEFSADLSPQLFVSNEENADLIDGSELRKIQSRYPKLPREVGLVAHNSITGQKVGVISLGGPDFYAKKEVTAKNFIINTKYKEDFFFKHALKVPYLKELDWEVNMKLHEKGVRDSPNIPYCLLRIVYAESDSRGLGSDYSVTMAIGRSNIDQFIAALTDLRAALEKCSDH